MRKGLLSFSLACVCTVFVFNLFVGCASTPAPAVTKEIKVTGYTAGDCFNATISVAGENEVMIGWILGNQVKATHIKIGQPAKEYDLGTTESCYVDTAGFTNNFHMIWFQGNVESSRKVVHKRFDGLKWSDAIVVNDQGPKATDLDMISDKATKSVHVVWADSYIYYRAYENGKWGQTEILSSQGDAVHPDINSTEPGLWNVVWGRKLGDRLEMVIRRNVEGEWKMEEKVLPPHIKFVRPKIVQLNDTASLVLWVEGEDILSSIWKEGQLGPFKRVNHMAGLASYHAQGIPGEEEALVYFTFPWEGMDEVFVVFYRKIGLDAKTEVEQGPAASHPHFGLYVDDYSKLHLAYLVKKDNKYQLEYTVKGF